MIHSATNEVNVVIYLDYERVTQLTELEYICISRLSNIARDNMDINVYVITDLLDCPLLDYTVKLSATKLKSYVDSILSDAGLPPRIQLKPYHYADYTAYHLIDVLKDVYGIYVNAALKLDTDYFLTSKFILRDYFFLETSFIGSDYGFRPSYNVKLPNEFRNVHLIYESIHDRLNISTSIFIECLIDSIDNNHYTATGPHLLNKYYKDDYKLESFTPCTLNPSLLQTWSLPTLLRVELAPGTLGIHLQSSLVKDAGYQLVNSCDSIKLVDNCIELLFTKIK